MMNGKALISLFLIPILLESCGGRSTNSAEKGRIVLEVSYGKEGVAKLAEVQAVEQMVVQVIQGETVVVQQDLRLEGSRWKGEIEIDAGSYRVEVEAVKFGKVEWRGITAVSVLPGKTTRASILMTSTNMRPLANAGKDQRVVPGTAVQLDGSGSSDADGDELSYQWTAPAGINLNGATNIRSFFSTTTAGTYTCTLVVNDGQMDSAPDKVTVTVRINRPPIASAGSDQTVNVRTLVQLDGSGSSDADGDALSYRWQQVLGEAVDLSDSTSAIPSFTPSSVGAYQFRLVVNDGLLASISDTTVVTVEAGGPMGAARVVANISEGGKDSLRSHTEVAVCAYVVVTGPFMTSKIRQELTVGVSSVFGLVEYIPAGRDREFTVTVFNCYIYSDWGMITKNYTGTNVATITAGEVVEVPVVLEFFDAHR